MMHTIPRPYVASAPSRRRAVRAGLVTVVAVSAILVAVISGMTKQPSCNFVSFIGGVDRISDEKILPSHNTNSKKAHDDKTPSEKSHQITRRWSWIFAATLSLGISFWACISGVDRWRNRSDLCAFAYFALGGGAAWLTVWVLATRIA